MNNEVLQDFTTFLGAINFDCSGNRLDYIMEGNKMVFKDASIQKVFTAYRKILSTGYMMGQKAMYNSMSLVQGEFLNQSMALAPK